MSAMLELQEKSQALLQSALKNAAGASLAASLVPLALAAAPADAQMGGEPPHSARVDSAVTQSSSLYNYSFTVFNTSPNPNTQGIGGIPLLVNWELPIFNVNDVNNIQSPAGWTYEIVDTDGNLIDENTGLPTGGTSSYFNNPSGPYGDYGWDYDPNTDPDRGNYLNPDAFIDPPYIIHWYTPRSDYGGNNPILPIWVSDVNFLSGFGFESDFASTNAPYLSSWDFLRPRVGDPPIPGGAGFGFPNSPSYRNFGTAVPEPSTFALLMAGSLVGVGLRLRRRAAS
jgi:hypothetical protein